MKTPIVNRSRTPFPTPLPSQEKWDSLEVTGNPEATHFNRRKLIEKWYADLISHGWKIQPASKLDRLTIADNCTSISDKDGRRYYPNLKYRPECVTVRLSYPRDMRFGELWASVLPQWALFTDLKKHSIELPSMKVKGNLYEFDGPFPAICFIKVGSKVDLDINLDNANYAFQSKKPFRAGSYNEDSAKNNGGVISKNEESNLTQFAG